MEMDKNVERLLDAQPDYIKDLHRRLQLEYKKAGLHGGSAGDTLGFGFGAEGGAPKRCWPDAQDAALSPRRDIGLRWAPGGSPDEGAGQGDGRRAREGPGPQPLPGLRFPAEPAAPVAAARGPGAAVPPLAAAPRGPAEPGPAPVGATPRCAAAVAKEVLRLRLMKRQHDDLRAQLTKAEGQLRRLSPCAISTFHSYLEKHLGDPELAVQMQEAIVNLVECLCAVCHVELPSATPEGLLSGVRRLLRDPHGFARRLCGMPQASSAEAEGLAPFLLSEVQYRKVREKDVNASYEALHAWLSAFYFFSAVSDQVSLVAAELERQERLLQRLDGQQEASPGGRATQAVSPRAAGPKAAPGAKAGRAALPGAKGELARSPAPGARSPAAGAAVGAASGAAGAGPGAGRQPLAGGAPPARSGAQSPGVARRTARANASALEFESQVPAPVSPGSQLPRMQSLQSDALLTYLRARKREGPPPPGSYTAQAMSPEQLQMEMRWQDGIHRRSSAPAFKDWEALRGWQKSQ